MKQRNKYIFANIETILSEKYTSIFIAILLIVTGYFCSTLDRNNGYFEALVSTLTNQQFLTFCFFPLFLISNYLLIELFEKSTSYIIRFENKTKYIKELLKNIFCLNTILFFIMMIVILTFFNFFANGNLVIRFVDKFHTYNIIYAFYTVLKLYIVMVVISFLFALMTKFFNKLLSLLVSVILSTSLYYLPMLISPQKTSLYFGFYLMDSITYSSFSEAIVYFAIFIAIELLITFIFFRFVCNRMKRVGN